MPINEKHKSTHLSTVEAQTHKEPRTTDAKTKMHNTDMTFSTSDPSQCQKEHLNSLWPEQVSVETLQLTQFFSSPHDSCEKVSIVSFFLLFIGL